MLPINELTNLLQGTMTNANIRVYLQLIASFFCVRYEITTKSLSRYSDYSKRHIFRFLKENHDWLKIRVAIFNFYVHNDENHYIVAVDETVEGKSGKSSFGIDRFYSSCAQKTIKSVCFFALSLINVKTKTSYMIDSQQVVYTEEDKKRIEAQKQKTKEGNKRTKEGKNLKKGRTKGSCNKKCENHSVSFRTFKGMWLSAVQLLKSVCKRIKITHLVADSAYGTSDYLNLAYFYGIYLISKLNKNAALYACAPKIEGKRGAPKKYGEKIDLGNIDEKYLKVIKTENENTYKYYQFEAYSKSIKNIKLNIVVQKIINKAGKISINIWFTNDLTLDYSTILEYYSMRFQIEFDFRDAKQHFGMSDFKNYTKPNLTNFVNMSFTMTLLSKVILEKSRNETNNPKVSILDLKIIANAQYTARNIIKWLQIPINNNIYLTQICSYIPGEIINVI